MKDIIKPAAVLAAVTFCASLLLATVFAVTKERIAFLDSEAEKNALAIVLPGYSITDTAKTKGNKIYWVGEKTENGETINGFAFISESPGYSGTIRCMIGVDSNMTILGISILKQTETPGLGARSVEIASKNTFWDVITGSAVDEGIQFPWFQQQFAGLNGNKTVQVVKNGDWTPEMASDLVSQNAVSAITGATITSKAVVDCIHKGISEYNDIIKKK